MRTRIGLILLFIMLSSTIGIGSHRTNAAEPTYLKIINPLTGNEWFSFTAQNKSEGDTFTLNITVDNVVNLFGWQIAVQWNSSLLEFVRVILPPNNVFAGQNPVVRAPDASIAGMVTYAAGAGPRQLGFSGSGVLFQVELDHAGTRRE